MTKANGTEKTFVLFLEPLQIFSVAVENDPPPEAGFAPNMSSSTQVTEHKTFKNNKCFGELKRHLDKCVLQLVTRGRD